MRYHYTALGYEYGASTVVVGRNRRYNTRLRHLNYDIYKTEIEGVDHTVGSGHYNPKTYSTGPSGRWMISDSRCEEP